jgi:hypothetical protein
MTASFVPEDFVVLIEFDGTGFRLEPLGPEHNERDHDAWMSSIEHITATPGFPDGTWPSPMSLESNMRDLVRHASDFENRTGFTYSILDGDDVIGCMYIYPSRDDEHGAEVSSWVRQSRADMDAAVWRQLSAWLADVWPFETVDYAARP